MQNSALAISWAVPEENYKYINVDLGLLFSPRIPYRLHANFFPSFSTLFYLHIGATCGIWLSSLPETNTGFKCVLLLLLRYLIFYRRLTVNSDMAPRLVHFDSGFDSPYLISVASIHTPNFFRGPDTNRACLSVIQIDRLSISSIVLRKDR